MADLYIGFDLSTQQLKGEFAPHYPTMMLHELTQPGIQALSSDQTSNSFMKPK